MQNYEIKIKSDGTWFHKGEKIKRLELIRLFSSVLHFKEDGHYWLITPHESGIIEVEDAPFIITDLNCLGSGKSLECWFTNNIQEKFLLSSKYPLNIIFNEKNEPRPYIKLDRGLKALISRPVFYNMVDLAIKGKNNYYGLWSDNQFFPIGKYRN